ncbi:hypothetical protein PybrP1_000022 [[Pythium] brassicae (nom. inval.)]|nr:hypothetical protein PybrP1_000022 [[Pythium] brassicae (nom. inval.)]
MSTFRMIDEDVEMTPAYLSPPEHIVAPRLLAWNHGALIRWKKERAQYERCLKECCSATGEQYDNIVVSVTGSIDAQLLPNLATYVFECSLNLLTDAVVRKEIDRRCNTVKNAYLPDIEALFAEKLRMDLREDDVEADSVVRTKNRTTILISNLAPPMLKREIERLVKLEYRRVKTDELALYKLVLDDGVPPTTAKSSPAPTPASRAPPRGGCLLCQGPHWVDNCPTGTDQEEAEAKNALRLRLAAKHKAKRAALNVGQASQLTAVLCGSVEVSVCVDTGSDMSILPRAMMEALPVNAFSVHRLPAPVSVEVVGGVTFKCSDQVTVDVQIRSAADRVNIRAVKCLVLDEGEAQFILSKDVLMSLGIDIGAMIENLAGPASGSLDYDDVTREDDVGIGSDADGEVEQHLAELKQSAKAEERDDELESRLAELEEDHYRDARKKLSEGDPWQLGKRGTVNYPKVDRSGTPQVKDASRDSYQT